jgi:hypothetical protein
MIDGELKVIGQAWECQNAAGIDTVPVSIEKYLQVVHADMEVRYDLEPSEAGQCFEIGAKRIIWINGTHSLERQRFTALHEIAHLYLNLPSKHGRALSVHDLLRYSSRPREEILCDVFASECLFPRRLFTDDVGKYACGMQSVQKIAEDYCASLTATGSRFVAYSREPCAWILADDRKVRYVSCSPTLREAGFWLPIGIEVPKHTVLGKLIAGTGDGKQDAVPLFAWTNNECKGISEFCEEAILVPSISQGMALIWAEELDERDRPSVTTRSEDDELLPELDGQLQFSKRTRRR